MKNKGRLFKYTVVQMLLRELATPLKNNRYAGVWIPTPILMQGCEHVETVCLECVDIWEQDYHLRTFAHGEYGYRGYGCRCEVCSYAVMVRKSS